MPAMLSPSEQARLSRKVSSFHALYGTVTGQLRNRWCALRTSGGRNTARWLAFLIAHFRADYREWPTNHLLADYIRIFLPRRVSPLMSLSGWVYLHVAHDLPLVIAESLSATSRLPGRGNPPIIDRVEARLLYTALTPEFAESFYATAKSGRLGVRAWVGSRLPFSKQAFGALAYWVITLRQISWTYAECLADTGNTPAQQQRLRDAVRVAAAKAASRFWILGLPIDPPLLALLPLSLVLSSPELALFGLVASVAMLACWRLYEARVIAGVGKLIYAEISYVLGEWRSSPEAKLR
jgi:hypothetical protein